MDIIHGINGLLTWRKARTSVISADLLQKNILIPQEKSLMALFVFCITRTRSSTEEKKNY